MTARSRPASARVPARTRPTSAVTSSARLLPSSSRGTIRPKSACAGSRKQGHPAITAAAQFAAQLSARNRALSPLRMVDHKDDAVKTLQSLQSAFKEIVVENADLKTQVQGAEVQLNTLLTQTRQGRAAAEVQSKKKEMEELKVHVNRVEGNNQELAKKQCTMVKKVKEKDFYMRYYQRESDSMRQVAVELQRESMAANNAPMFKALNDRVRALAKRQVEVVELVKRDAEKHEANLVLFQEKMGSVDETVKELHAMTKKLVDERSTAAKLITEGREKMEEFQKAYKALKKELQKMRTEINEGIDTCTKSTEARAKDVKRVDDVTKNYKETLEELVGNNKWHKQRHEEIAQENEELKAENAKLLESLMSYLLLNQKAEAVKNTPSEKALGPLCPKANRMRVMSPRDEMPSTVPLKPLSERLYPAESSTGDETPDMPTFTTKEEAISEFRGSMPSVLRKAGLDAELLL